jgi:hypothetical protein
MNRILKDLKKRLSLNYIAIFSKEGFIVFEEKDDDNSVQSEIIAGELSVILKNSRDFSNDAMRTDFKSLFIKLKNGKGVSVDYINDDFFIVAILSENSIFSKYNYFINKEKVKINSVL